MEASSTDKPFITVTEFGHLLGVRRARAYALAHELGIAVRLGERKLVVPRRAVEELTRSAVDRVRELTAFR